MADPTVSSSDEQGTYTARDLGTLRNASPSRAEMAFIGLAGVFIGALVITNAISAKVFELFGRELTAGIIAYPITFLVTDLISEIYGRKRANTLVGAGFIVSVFVTAIVWIAVQAPMAEGSPVTQEAYNQVFGFMPGIVFGSMVAYLTAQFIDVQMFEFWRNLTGGKHMWLRNNGSTWVSQLIDTTLVVTIALVIWPTVDGNPGTEPLAWGVWQSLVIGQYLFKIAIAAIDTPIFYVASYALKRWIQNDPLLAEANEVPATETAAG